MPALTRIGRQTDILGECPLWHVAEQALYWVDIRAPAIRRFDYRSGVVETWMMPDLVGCIAFADDGRLIVALPDRLALFERATCALATLAALTEPIPGHRFNDGRCDRQGRFWIGSMHNITRAPEGVLYRLDPGGRLSPVLTGIAIPNSLAWSPDGRTMYFADSPTFAIEAYDYDTAHGTIGQPRTFCRTKAPAFPDGSAIDADGCLWNAEFKGSRLVRYAPDGRIDRTIALPADRPTCCAFGGPDLDILYVTTTSQDLTPAQRTAEPFAGGLFAIKADVKGLPEPVCRLGELFDGTANREVD